MTDATLETRSQSGSTRDITEAGIATNARRVRNRHRTAVYALRVLVLVVILGAWELASDRLIDDFTISQPTEIAATWWGWVVDGTLWYNGRSTLEALALGFPIGLVAALVVGFVMGSSPRLIEIFEPFITAIYSLPKLALVPLLVTWVGIGMNLGITMAALVSFFLMFYNTYFGVRDVDQTLVNSVRILGAGRAAIALLVRFPSALIWVVAGLKITIPQSLIAVVIAEILASDRGLGHLVALNSGQFNTKGTFAALFTLLIVGFTVDRCVSYVSNRALAWRQELSA